MSMFFHVRISPCPLYHSPLAQRMIISAIDRTFTLMYILDHFIIRLIRLGVYTNVWTSQILRKKILQAQKVVIMPTITISETYDLATTKGRIGLLGIHTPGIEIIRKLYPGLLLNYSKMKVESADLAVACASLLPADPLQVGTEAGDIAPQDLFNPILYRAVSSESFNTILNRVYGLGNFFNNDGSLGANNVSGYDPFPSISDQNEEDLYYGLLSEGGWRKAMPQSGLQMRDLVPIVYQMINNYGNTRFETVANVVPQNVNAVSDAGAEVSTALATTMRGPSMHMPAFPTLKGMTSGTASSSGWNIPVGTPVNIPKTFVAAIVLPPSKLHRMFFRMTIRWRISFYDLVSIVERGNLTQIQSAGIQTYGIGYVDEAKMKDTEDKVDVSENTVDTLGIDTRMIMQS